MPPLFQALGSSTRTEASDTQHEGLKIELELFDVENNTRESAHSMKRRRRIGKIRR